MELEACGFFNFIIFQAKLADKKGYFNIYDSLNEISSKLIKRHPNIFIDNSNLDSNDLSWEKAKKEEKNRESVIDGVPISLPALTRARRIQEKASSVGFDWKELSPVWKKVNEEIAELQEVLNSKNSERIQDEIGDVLFSVVNLSRFLEIDPESSLRHTIRKFESRFKKVEEELDSRGSQMKSSTLEEMDKIWNKVKKEK